VNSTFSVFGAMASVLPWRTLHENRQVGNRQRAPSYNRPMDHEIQTPSPWVARWASLIRPGGEVLDVAAGSGRHTRYLAARGFEVTAVDRDATALAPLASLRGVRVRAADLEAGAWPFAPEAFDGVVVSNYLHRPLFASLLAALRPGGILIYETFMQGNERFGRPSNPAFLLRPGELLEVLRDRLTIVAFEQGRVDGPKPAIVQRVCAARGAPAETVTIR
jgi:SAM-dependent methyltransferase